MPLNASEKTAIAEAFLKCFGEDYQITGRALKFVAQFTAGQTDLLTPLLARASTWQPFIDSGLSINYWKSEVQRIYNLTDTA